MKRHLSILTCLLLLALPLSAEDNPPEFKLFAALGMTKSQKASPLPTDSGVFLYDTLNQRWRRFGPTIQQVNSMAADPSNPANIFLACGNGIVRSQNNGKTWKMVTGWRESDITKIAVDPSNGQNVYAATAWGVVISRDGGDTWSEANTGLVEKLSKSIVVDHLNPTRLLVATTAGLFESMDSAASWEQVQSAPDIAILGLSRSLADTSLWVAGTEGGGVIISKDDGRTWKPSAPELSHANIYGVTTNPHDRRSMAAGGWTTGIWISTDGGAHWMNRSEGLPSMNVTKTAFDQTIPGRLWVSTFEEGTFYSDDLGETWRGDEIIKPGAAGSILGAFVVDLGFVPTTK